MSVSKQVYDVARKSFTEHGQKMKSRFVSFHQCYQYWIEAADSKAGGKDVQAEEAKAVADSGESQAYCRLHARAGFVMDCVPLLAASEPTIIRKFARLIEFSATGGFSWSNATDRDSVAAFAALSAEERTVEAASKESYRLKPKANNGKGKEKSAPVVPPATEPIPSPNSTDMEECADYALQAIRRSKSPLNSLGAILSALSGDMNVLIPAIAACNPPMIDGAFDTLSKDIAKTFLLACVGKIGEEEATEIIMGAAGNNGTSAPTIDTGAIEAQLQAA